MKDRTPHVPGAPKPADTDSQGDTDKTVRPIDAAWIAETRALCEAATVGPWRVNADMDVSAEHCSVAHGLTAEDSRLIAAARTALPAALGEIERLRSAIPAHWTPDMLAEAVRAHEAFLARRQQ